MPAIFISYRREDSTGYSGRLYDRLTAEFGKGQVFMDIDSIDPGADFVEVIERTVASCDAVLVVIGKQWLTVCDAQGRRRIENPEDFVRLEVEIALSRKVRVVPVLVGGAQMPRSDELPEALAGLSRRHALILPDTAFHQALERLLDSLRRNEPQGRGQAEPERLALDSDAGERVEREGLAHESVQKRAAEERRTGNNEAIVPKRTADMSIAQPLQQMRVVDETVSSIAPASGTVESPPAAPEKFPVIDPAIDISGDWDYVCWAYGRSYEHGGTMTIEVKITPYGPQWRLLGTRRWRRADGKTEENIDYRWHTEWAAFTEKGRIKYEYITTTDKGEIHGFADGAVTEIRDGKPIRIEGRFYQLPPVDPLQGGYEFARVSETLRHARGRRDGNSPNTNRATRKKK